MSTDSEMSMTETDRKAMRRLVSIFGLLRAQDGEMPVQQMLVFSWVALNEGGFQRDLSAALSMASSTASRNIAALSLVHRLGKPGLGLITWVDDPLDRRAKRLVVTEKGRAIARQILDLM